MSGTVMVSGRRMVVIDFTRELTNVLTYRYNVQLPSKCYAHRIVALSTLVRETSLHSGQYLRLRLITVQSDENKHPLRCQLFPSSNKSSIFLFPGSGLTAHERAKGSQGLEDGMKCCEKLWNNFIAAQVTYTRTVTHMAHQHCIKDSGGDHWVSSLPENIYQLYLLEEGQ